MRREGTPAWMQVVERRLEQAAEDARSRPAQAGIQGNRAGMLNGLRFPPTRISSFRRRPESRGAKPGRQGGACFCRAE